MASRNELAERTARWPERIEFFEGQAVFGARAPEVREFPGKFCFDIRAHRLVDARGNFDVASIDPNVPGVGRGDHQISADEFAPVHVVAKSGGEQAGSITSLAEEPISLL